MSKFTFKICLAAPVLAGVLFITGCVSLEPALPEADPDIPVEWPLPETTETAETAAGDDLAVAEIGWTDFFVDPKLEALIGRALENNRDLRVAMLNVERARALYRIERADRFPFVNATGSVNRTGGESRASVDDYRVELGVAAFELDLFGRVQHLSEAALQRYFATEEARRAAQLALVAEMANAYLTLAADQELQRIAEATLENFEEEFVLTQRRYELGAVSALDVSQARTIVQSARADAARFAGQVARDIHALTLLSGGQVEPSLLPETFDPQVSGISALPPELPSEVLLRRPDVLRAELQLRATNASIGAARAAFFPSITLTAAVGTASDELSGLFGDGSGVWSFAPRINLPIFQAGRLQANLEVAEADRDIALAEYERAIRVGFREVSDALALSRTLAQERQARAAMVEAAEETHALSETRYRAGQDSYLILLDAQRTLYNARQALITTQLAEQANRINLYKVLGGGWKEETE